MTSYCVTVTGVIVNREVYNGCRFTSIDLVSAMYRAVALALSAMPMTLALVSLGLSLLLLLVGGAQGQHDHAAATTTGCPPGQRQAVGYPMVCDPAYKADTASGVDEGGSGTYNHVYMYTSHTAVEEAPGLI